MNKMKRSFMQIKIIAVVILLLSACSQEDEYVTKGENEIPSQRIEITVSARDFVTDGAPDTRTTDNGKETTFEDGDRVGIIILDKKNNLIYDNIPYKYINGNWTFDINNDDSKGGCYYDPKAETYIVYYPYSRAADGVTSVDVLKTKFAPKFNQSDIKDYRSSDLMVWWGSSSHLPSSVTMLNAVLEHAFASVYLTPKVTGKYKLEDNTSYSGSRTPDISDISDVSLTIDNVVYVPYQAKDGSLRCIIPIDIASRDIRCFYTIGSNTYGNTISILDAVDANTCYACEPTIGDVTYSLGNARVGDFYCKNSDKGYLIPGDVTTLTDEQKAACIGIVYCTDIDRIGDEAKKVLKDKGVAAPHGLVMALTNASEQCRWGENGRDENYNGTAGTPFKDNTRTLQKQYNNVDGYGETHWILNTYKANGNALKDTYSAFYHASRYGTVDSGTSQYAAPNTTTGWFIPSMGQWWDILSNLGGINLTNFRESGGFSTYISGAARIAVKNMNNYLGKIEDATKFNTGPYFWSSSECSSDVACRVAFYSDGNLSLSYGNKDGSHLKVRCVFAF